MLLAEELALGGGATTLGLNVFANNVVARSQYTSLKYERDLRPDAQAAVGGPFAKVRRGRTGGRLRIGSIGTAVSKLPCTLAVGKVTWTCVRRSDHRGARP